MITNMIVFLSFFFGVAYTLIWFFRKDIREQIERPKFNFQDQIECFENQCQIAADLSAKELTSNDTHDQ